MATPTVTLQASCSPSLEGKGREEKGREGKGREGKGREGPIAEPLFSTLKAPGLPSYPVERSDQLLWELSGEDQ